MDFEPAYSTVDCVVGRRVESAHANSCCCVPKLSTCPSITGFPYRYVGVFYVGDMEKNPTEKTESVGRFLFWGATEKPSLTVAKTRKKMTKKDFIRFSVHNPGPTSQIPSRLWE